MATKDRFGNWITTENDRKRRADAKVIVEANRAKNYANTEDYYVAKDGSLHDKKTGKFVKGTKNKTTFADRPQDAGGGGWNKENVASYQYKRFMNMERNEFIHYGKCTRLIDFDRDKKGRLAEDPEKYPYRPHTMAEELGYLAVMKARNDLDYLKDVNNRVEGTPTQHVEAKVESKIQNMTDDELKAIARAEFGSEKNE